MGRHKSLSRKTAQEVYAIMIFKIVVEHSQVPRHNDIDHCMQLYVAQ